MKKPQVVLLVAIMSALAVVFGVVSYNMLMPKDGGPMSPPKPGPQVKQIRSFQECVEAGNPVMESYPRRCNAGSQTFVETVSESPDGQAGTMTESEARKIAEKTCIKGGEALGAGSYNGATKTWWFDANLNYVKQGCNPACVVSEDTSTAEINWRCTGLLPQAASLTSHKWTWVASEKEGRVIEPKKPDTFSLVFGDDGNVAIGTDCNSMSASYTAKDGKISLSEIATTMMYCEGSQEQEFSGLLRGVSKYEITPSGEPMLELSLGKTFVIFKGVGR